MQYSARNLAACLLAIYTHETLARPQAIPFQSSNVSSETTVPIATSAETPVSLRPLAGLASSAVGEAATLVTTTSELIPLIPQTSTTAGASVVSQVQSTEVTSAATATLNSSSLIASNTAVAEDSAFPSSVALETTATEPSTTETATADATSTSATSGFLASVVIESSTSASSAVAETSRAAITSRPSGFFPITNGTAPGASGVAGGKPHGTGAAHQSLVTGISSPSGSGGLKFGDSTQTSGLSSAVPTSKGGSSLTTLTTVSDGITQTLVTAIAAQTSGVARNASTTATTGSNSGAGRPMDMVGGALVAGAAGMLGMMLL